MSAAAPSSPEHVHSPPAWALDNPLRRWFSPPRRVVDRLDPRPGERVADLGAGVGYFAETLLDRLGPGGHLTMVDLNARHLERFERRHGPDPRVTFVVGGAASVPSLGPASQDRVLLANVLCDVPDKRELLDEAWRLLRPGGNAYASFHWAPQPLPSHPFWVIGDEWDRLVRAHPWQELAHGEEHRMPWHLLRKPA
jgi:SAM-dependent methyltransferase